MQVDCRFIAANTNPVYHALAQLSGGIVVYCASNQVLVHNTRKLATSLGLNLNPVDPGRCNCLVAYETHSHGYVVAGYEQGELATFECPKGKYENYQQWRIAGRTKQDASIITIHVLKREDSVILTTINNKASCRVYIVAESANLKEVFSLNFPLNKIPEAVCLFPIDKTSLLLAVGGMDHQIHLYVSEGDGFQFDYVDSLKGHENAITKLAAVNTGVELLLASSSKDGYIRVWKMSPDSQVPAFQKSKYPLFKGLSIYLESILIAHECSTTNLAWSTRLTKSPLSLVSTSMDCTVGVWQRDDSGVWLVRYRLGQLYGNKNSFFSVMINETERYIMTANFTGASCVWQYQEDRDCFQSLPSFSGHFSDVTGLAWNHTGDFLVSCSKDQTTRVYCEHHESHNYNEISRAQIHGYDINTVALVPVGEKMVDLIACGADEKVIRIIEPPASATNLLNCHTRANLHLYFETEAQERSFLAENKQWLEYQTMSEGGTQVLGLMTKAHRVERQKITNYYEGDEEEEQVVQEGQTTANTSAAYNFNKVPTEDYLVKHTLWPEMNKLYGHPYELLSLAVGRGVIASSCHSLSSESAFIVVWDLKTWKMVQQLHHHKSSVNALKYSPDGRYLAAVSKDRTLSVYFAEQNYKIKFAYEAHTRALTACDISSDSQLLATVSRDKSLKLHSLEEGKPVCEYKFKHSPYSVAFHPSRRLVACGLEDGSIYFLEILEKDGIKEVDRVPDFLGHSKLVSKLCWTNRKGRILLASGSHDHTVRIFELAIDKQ